MLLSHHQSDLYPPEKSPSEHTCGKKKYFIAQRDSPRTRGNVQHMLRIIQIQLILSVSVCTRVSHLSSSSSMKPLPSTSKTRKTCLTSSADIALIPTSSKNFLGSNVSAAKNKDRTCGVHHHLTLISQLPKW